MPAVFFGHGSPMNTLESNRYTAAWRALGQRRPRAILMVSAHWCTRGTAVTAMACPRTIHDFAGFPQALFEVQYPAAGDPALAARVQQLLAPAAVAADHDWGLDHGTWSVLAHAFPQADVPVVQLSLDLAQPPRHHLELARRLAPLRDEGVLIFGSGFLTHNMRYALRPGIPPWAREFDNWAESALSRLDVDELVDFEKRAPAVRMALPTWEHYAPVLVAAGAVAEQRPTTAFPITGWWMDGAFTRRSVQFG
jgi:4,5-DOPA dioxygenase extradiol